MQQKGGRGHEETIQKAKLEIDGVSKEGLKYSPIKRGLILLETCITKESFNLFRK